MSNATPDSYQRWEDKLDALCVATLGLSLWDLPDLDYFNMHADGAPPDLDTLADLLMDAGETSAADLVYSAMGGAS